MPRRYPYVISSALFALAIYFGLAVTYADQYLDADISLGLPIAARTLSCFDEVSRAGDGKIDGTQYPAWWFKHARQAEHA